MRAAEPGLTSPGYRLTASVGFAMLPEGGGDIDELLDHADRELRRAKTAGKDRWDAAALRRPERRGRKPAHAATE